MSEGDAYSPRKITPSAVARDFQSSQLPETFKPGVMPGMGKVNVKKLAKIFATPREMVGVYLQKGEDAFLATLIQGGVDSAQAQKLAQAVHQKYEKI